jgi:hypothetical protein
VFFETSTASYSLSGSVILTRRYMLLDCFDILQCRVAVSSRLLLSRPDRGRLTQRYLSATIVPAAKEPA